MVGQRSDRGKVYPRVCGGTLIGLRDSMLISGLSPHTRGNPTRFVSSCCIMGSIPACAGEPYDGGRP